MNVSTLPTLLQRFFTDRLTAQLQASPNTIAGYRDTFRLLFRFASQRRNRPPTKLRSRTSIPHSSATSSPTSRRSAATAPAAETRGSRRSDRSIDTWP